jgi:CheY-like chemotaxis protein
MHVIHTGGKYDSCLQSRGNIFVYSEPGRGTTFKIYLPRVAIHETAEVVVIPERIPSLGNEIVMVVEDDSSLRGLIERVLAAAGYKVVSFGSADEAMVAFEQGVDGIDLLLTDVVLSGVMQGNDLARCVHESRPDLPVRYMSGYTRNAIVHVGRLDEGVNFLEKPFTPEALARTVRQVLDQASASG